MFHLQSWNIETYRRVEDTRSLGAQSWEDLRIRNEQGIGGVAEWTDAGGKILTNRAGIGVQRAERVDRRGIVCNCLDHIGVPSLAFDFAAICAGAVTYRNV